MPFSSSSVEYPSSSGLQKPNHKRKLFQSFSRDERAAKKPKSISTSVLTLSQVEESVQSEPMLEIQEESIHELSDDEHDFTHRLTADSVKSLSSASRGDSPDSEFELPNLARAAATKGIHITTHAGKTILLTQRQCRSVQTYESLISERSVTREGRAKRAYYGVEIQKLLDESKIQNELHQTLKEEQIRKAQEVRPTVEAPVLHNGNRDARQMWTEKYRARKFTELVGDERTHRQVLKWLKVWDTIVFPSAANVKSRSTHDHSDNTHEYQNRKILLLTGPPGLGKTTLAHVCAKQAGYEVLEVNASDDRSRDVVKGRIKDALGTETVRGVKAAGKGRKAGRPVCVVVDEVDGVVTGTGNSGGEGGFMKALIDLVQLDQKNSSHSTDSAKSRSKKGDRFRLFRPLILICNDVYAPSLRPLRMSGLAEVVHVRKPPLEKVISRLKSVFEREQVSCDNDAVRRLCESTWGLGTRKQHTTGARGIGEGDIRGVLVQAEWLANKLRSCSISEPGTETRLTRKWVETNLNESTGQKGFGRGDTREIVDRIFLEGAGMSNLPTTLSADEQRQILESKSSLGLTDLRKRTAINALHEIIATNGSHDQLLTDCFATYPTRVFQDDTLLSKPNSAYDWLHFHDEASRRVHSEQEWELMPYLSATPCAFHNLFASVDRGAASWSAHAMDVQTEDGPKDDVEEHPFAGLRADYLAREAAKVHKSTLTELQSSFSGEILRLFSSIDAVAVELVPQLTRMVAPDVKPVVVGGSGAAAATASVRKESERRCVTASAQIMHALNINFEKVRIESEGYGNGGTAYRMEPCIDELGAFHMGAKTKTHLPTRYAVRQVLDQEIRKCKSVEAHRARLARSGTLNSPATQDLHMSDDKENSDPGASKDEKVVKLKKDFFGRVITNTAPTELLPDTSDANTIAKNTARKGKARQLASTEGGRIWVSFNEGFSNAVRKPITLKELLDSF